MGTAKSSNVNEIYQDIKATFGQVPTSVREVPDSVLPGFWSIMKNFQLAETAIPGKYKELIGLAVAGATRCRYCALFHTEAARLNGATDEEIQEASAMAGHTMNASTILNASQVDYETFRRETLEAIEYVKAQLQKQQPHGRPTVGQLNRPSASRH